MGLETKGDTKELRKRILFLDLGRVTGWCDGHVNETPSSRVVILRKPSDDPALGIGKLARELRDYVRTNGKPDILGVEKWMPLPASKNDAATEDALRLNGAVHAVCGVYGIPVVEPAASEIRKAVCGHAFGPGPKGDRGTKQMVLDTVLALKLLPREAIEQGDSVFDRADAVAGWQYVSATMFGRMRFALTA